MDLEAIDKAIKSYNSVLDVNDRKRLAFFHQIWSAMSQFADDNAIADIAYTMPGKSSLIDLYRENVPVFRDYPVEIDASLFASALDVITDKFVDNEIYSDDVCEQLKSIEWQKVLDSTNLATAGSNPSVWLEKLVEKLATDPDDSNQEDEQHKPLNEQVIAIALVIASLSLRIFLQDPSREIMQKLEGGKERPRSLTCPVCGTAPSQARVGGNTSSSGKGRQLVCAQCGAEWEFERIRCARCGTSEQHQLVYRHIDDDDAHRLAICSKCGGTMRTLFSEDAEAPYSAEVEDVVMVKLDALSRTL